MLCAVDEITLPINILNDNQEERRDDDDGDDEMLQLMTMTPWPPSMMTMMREASSNWWWNVSNVVASSHDDPFPFAACNPLCAIYYYTTNQSCAVMPISCHQWCIATIDTEQNNTVRNGAMNDGWWWLMTALGCYHRVRYGRHGAARCLDRVT